MGCVTSNNKRVTMPATRVIPVRQYAQADKTGTFRVRILEAIKRKDPILFEKTLQRFQVKTNELVTTTDANKRSILHDIAEANFAEGMSLILDYLIQKDSNKMSFILNTTDSQGNTPIMTCCLWNAPDTLDILLRYDLIDLNGKNLEGKTAVELAIENSTACVTILNTISAGGAKSMTRYTHSSAAEIAITPRHHTSILLKSNKKDYKLPPINKDNSAGSRDLSTPLTSVLSLTRESPSRVGPTSKLFNLINDLKDKDTNFIDEEFPHTIFSLMGEDSDENIPGLKWVRPTEFLNMDLKKIKLFEGIDLNDVSRSDLAGCDLYSALAAMTEFPQRLLNAFTIKEVNKYGAYSVKFLIAGIPVEIMLDDYFPCYENGQLVYSSPLGNEIWFLLIEKSFAKLYGSYSEIRRVYISEALELITGMPSSQHSVKEMEEEELWNNMYDYDKKNYIFCAGVYADEDDKNKIFTIINLYEDKQYKIIKLRNPFRDFEWDGLFSEKSKLWTKELKEEIGFAKGEKSAIYMEIKEFIEHFDFLSVCHYQDGWFRNRVDVVSDPSTAVFCEIVLEEETEVFISVHQRLPLYVTNSPDYDISPVEIMLAEKNDSNSFTKIACGENDAYLGKQTTYVDQKVKIRLPEGKYVMRVKIRWVDGNEHDFTVNTFSQKNLTLKQGREEDYPNFLEKVYLDAGRRMKERYLYSNSCELYSEWSGSHLWIYGVNNGKKTWNLEVLFQQFENIRLPKKYSKDEKTLQMIVLPGKQKVVYAKRIDDGKVEIQWNLKNKWE